MIIGPGGGSIGIEPTRQQQGMSLFEVRKKLEREGIYLNDNGIMRDAYGAERILGHGRIAYRNGAMEIDVAHPSHPAPLDPIQQSIPFVDLFRNGGIPVCYINNTPATVNAIEQDINRMVKFVAELRGEQK